MVIIIIINCIDSFECFLLKVGGRVKIVEKIGALLRIVLRDR